MDVEKYGASWDTDNPVLIEMGCIRAGGVWRQDTVVCGKGLLFHRRELARLLWPDDDDHRWAQLAMKVLTEERVVCLMGCASSGKTHPAAKDALMDYWTWPEECLTLVSTTEQRGLELRIWGRIKDLFNRARAIWGNILSGNVIDYKFTITTDEVDTEDNAKARVLTKGIICVPCAQGSRDNGIAPYIGVKQRRLTLIGDEAQELGWAIANACSNLNSNPNFKVRFMGNPKDPTDTLGRVCEPVAGWTMMAEPEKTTMWRSRFLNGMVINFVGDDSPNFDYPENEPDRYDYLIGRRFIKETGAFWGFESAQFYQMCKGVMRPGALECRVITRDIAVQNHAMEDSVIWSTAPRTKIYGVDAAYLGVGGDRCVKGWCEFGTASDGTQIFFIYPPRILHIRVDPKLTPEGQIAEAVYSDCTSNTIEPKNVFYDSTGRGTLGAAFAKKFGFNPPTPVEFGGRPSKRPVRHDLFVEDSERGQSLKRHKRCDEHYDNFVTELWFSARYVMECGQMRNLPEDVLHEGCLREYETVRGSKLKVESKEDPKALERMGRSPDLFDWLVTCVEGARQRGFKIERLGKILVESGPGGSGQPKWLADARKAVKDIKRKYQLSHS